jgi:hypothetical protein
MEVANWNEVKSVLMKLLPYVDATLSQQWGPQNFHCSNLCASCQRAQIFVVLSNRELLLVKIHSQIIQICNPFLSLDHATPSQIMLHPGQIVVLDAAAQLK